MVQMYQTTLPNGLEVIAELNPQAYSVAYGFFVRTGARDESMAVSGVSHFLEHMVFKGTDSISADEVNRVFDDYGANYNASTSEEVTLFHAAVLPEYLPQTFGLQASILMPALRDADFTTEKQVILEEIGMYDDEPMYVAYDAAMQTHFAGHSLGKTILGSRESITALTAEQIRVHHAAHYRAGNIVLAVTGNVSQQQVLDLAQQHCGHWTSGRPDRLLGVPKAAPTTTWIDRPALQTHQVMLLANAPGAANSLRSAAELLALVVGDDVNSRLYWDLVDPGIAETAEISFSEFDGCGAYMTYLSTVPEELENALEILQTTFARIQAHGITADELELAKNKIAARTVLRGERPMGRLSALGYNWQTRREYLTISDEVAQIERVTQQEIRNLLDAFPFPAQTIVGVGPHGAQRVSI